MAGWQEKQRLTGAMPHGEAVQNFRRHRQELRRQLLLEPWGERPGMRKNPGATETKVRLKQSMTIKWLSLCHYVQRRPGWSKILEMIQLDGARWGHKGSLHGQLGVHRCDGGCTRMHTDAQPAQGMAGIEILRSAWRRCGRIHCAVACLDYIITYNYVSHSLTILRADRWTRTNIRFAVQCACLKYLKCLVQAWWPHLDG